MAAAPAQESQRPDGALAGVRVLDLCDERGIYGTKLLADLGADVVRIEPPGGDPLRQRGPFKDDVPGPTNSLWHAFFASNRRFVTADLARDDGRRLLRRLLEWCDIVVESGALTEAGIGSDDLLAAKPSLVIVRVSSFGPGGPWRDYLAPDLVAGALGGISATTGDVDTPPLKPFGELNFMISGSYVAIGALAALHHARAGGEGQVVEAVVHEALASCLEHVLMWYWYSDRVRSAEDNVLPRRGSQHWSNTYQVMRAKGGAIMVTPTPDFQKQFAWLAEEDVHEDLLDEKYRDPDNVLALIERTMEVLRKWVATKEVEPFFFEAQARHAPYGWVLPPDRVAENPQLDARGWWRDYDLGGATVRGPGPPYHFSETPWSLRRPYAKPGGDSEAVLAEIGWAD